MWVDRWRFCPNRLQKKDSVWYQHLIYPHPDCMLTLFFCHLGV